MRFFSKSMYGLCVTAISLLAIPGVVSARSGITELEFLQPPERGSDTTKTLRSLVKVQGTGQFCQDGLYLMTQYGDREAVFESENQALIDNPFINQTWRFCSVFSANAGSSIVVGRNWDNQNVGSIIISLHRPPEGYCSISFSRSIDMGFGHKDLMEFQSSPFANKLLLAPFYAMDGMNEHGLTVAVAANNETSVRSGAGRESVFITFLIHKILNLTKNVEEAANLVQAYAPFLLDRDTLSGHLLVCDASGRSVVLEYDRDKWYSTYGEASWQVMSTKRIFNVPDADLRDGCWRYRSMSETLEKTGGIADWESGMAILRDVAQEGTTWSIIYRPPTKDLYLCVYQNWDDVYHLALP